MVLGLSREFLGKASSASAIWEMWGRSAKAAAPVSVWILAVEGFQSAHLRFSSPVSLGKQVVAESES